MTWLELEHGIKLLSHGRRRLSHLDFLKVPDQGLFWINLPDCRKLFAVFTWLNQRHEDEILTANSSDNQHNNTVG